MRLCFVDPLVLIRTYRSGILRTRTQAFAGLTLGPGKASDLGLVLDDGLMPISPAPGMSLWNIIFNADGALRLGNTATRQIHSQRSPAWRAVC